jgi:hypothetical protein
MAGLYSADVMGGRLYSPLIWRIFGRGVISPFFSAWLALILPAKNKKRIFAVESKIYLGKHENPSIIKTE